MNISLHRATRKKTKKRHRHAIRRDLGGVRWLYRDLYLGNPRTDIPWVTTSNLILICVLWVSCVELRIEYSTSNNTYDNINQTTWAQTHGVATCQSHCVELQTYDRQCTWVAIARYALVPKPCLIDWNVPRWVVCVGLKNGQMLGIVAHWASVVEWNGNQPEN